MFDWKMMENSYAEKTQRHTRKKGKEKTVQIDGIMR